MSDGAPENYAVLELTPEQRGAWRRVIGATPDIAAQAPTFDRFVELDASVEVES